MVQNMADNFIDKEILNRPRIIRKCCSLPENETSITDFVLLDVALIFADSALIWSQILFCGDQRNGKGLGALVKTELLEPFVEILEACFLGQAVAKNNAISLLAISMHQLFCCEISRNVLQNDLHHCVSYPMTALSFFQKSCGHILFTELILLL